MCLSLGSKISRVFANFVFSLSPSLIHDKGRLFQVLSNEYSRENKCVKDALRWEDGMQKISSHSGNLLFYSGAKISRFSDVAKVCISFRSAFCSIFCDISLSQYTFYCIYLIYLCIRSVLYALFLPLVLRIFLIIVTIHSHVRMLYAAKHRRRIPNWIPSVWTRI